MAEEIDQEQFSYLYFGVSMILVVLIPWGYKVIKKPISTFIFRSYLRDERYKQLSDHPSSLEKIKRSQKDKRLQWFTTSYIIQAVICLILLALFCDMYRQLPDPELMRGFDPYDVLGIQRSATTQEIKKAFRQLSVKYHPDKVEHPGKEAEAYFIKISKAYECLSNPKAQRNCEKYGNPDGFKGYQVGIAIPLSLDSTYFVMLAVLGYFIIAGGLLALCVHCFKSIGKYDNYGLLNDNKALYKSKFIHKDLQDFKDVFSLMTLLIEFQKYNSKEKIDEELDYYIIPMKLLQQYFRGEEMDQKDQDELAFIINTIDKGIESSIDYAVRWMGELGQRNFKHKSEFSRQDLSSYILTLAKSQAYFIQGQIPPVPQETMLENFQKLPINLLNMNGVSAVRLFHENKELLKSHNIKDEVIAELEYFPAVVVQTEVKTYFNDIEVKQMTISSIVNLKITIKQLNPFKYVHSLKFPHIRQHHYHVLLFYNDVIDQYHYLPDRQQELVMKIFPAIYSQNKHSKLHFKVQILSDSYIGLEYNEKFLFTVVEDKDSDKDASDEEEKEDKGQSSSDDEDEKLKRD